MKSMYTSVAPNPLLQLIAMKNLMRAVALSSLLLLAGWPTTMTITPNDEFVAGKKCVHRLTGSPTPTQEVTVIRPAGWRLVGTTAKVSGDPTLSKEPHPSNEVLITGVVPPGSTSTGLVIELRAGNAHGEVTAPVSA